MSLVEWKWHEYLGSSNKFAQSKNVKRHLKETHEVGKVQLTLPNSTENGMKGNPPNSIGTEGVRNRQPPKVTTDFVTLVKKNGVGFKNDKCDSGDCGRFSFSIRVRKKTLESGKKDNQDKESGLLLSETPSHTSISNLHQVGSTYVNPSTQDHDIFDTDKALDSGNEAKATDEDRLIAGAQPSVGFIPAATDAAHLKAVPLLAMDDDELMGSLTSSARPLVQPVKYVGCKDPESTKSGPYCCEVCAESFVSPSALCDHMRDHIEESHDVATSNEPVKNSDNKDFKISENGRCCCEVCTKSFVYPSALCVHMLTHAWESTHGKASTELAISVNCKEPQTDGGGPYCCEVCAKSLKSLYGLRVHMRIHTGEKPYACRICGKAFRYSCDMRTHVMLHEGVKTYACAECGKSFAWPGNLRDHMSVHTGLKQFACEKCGKRYKRSGSLKHHMRSHTGEKPYKCETCGKSFVRNSSLYVHRMKHDNRDYDCYECKRTLTRFDTFRRHMKQYHGRILEIASRESFGNVR